LRIAFAYRVAFEMADLLRADEPRCAVQLRAIRRFGKRIGQILAVSRECGAQGNGHNEMTKSKHAVPAFAIALGV